MTTGKRAKPTPRPSRAKGGGEAPPPPLGEREIAELQALLDTVPAPLEPLDVSAVDGFLCGVLVQPDAIAPARWLPLVTDVDGRALPRGFDARRLHALDAEIETLAAPADLAVAVEELVRATLLLADVAGLRVVR